jgi:hypothetical protein
MLCIDNLSFYNPRGMIRAFNFLSAVLVTLTCAVPCCAAEDITETPTTEADVQPEMSREQWRQRVQEAKRRAVEAALERRTHPDRYAPPPEDAEQVASERVLNDDSLQRGDIVSTKKGLFVFRGRSNREHREDDFLALPREAGQTSRVR